MKIFFVCANLWFLFLEEIKLCVVKILREKSPH